MKNKNEKYSLNDRYKYYGAKIDTVLDGHTDKKGKVDWNGYCDEIDKNRKLQYANGYISYSASPKMSLQGESSSFIKGFKAAEKAEKFSDNIKF